MRILARIGAALGGMLAGGFCVAGIQQISSLLYPIPDTVDPNDRQQINEWINALPTLAFLIVLASWAIGCFVGAWTARRLTPLRSLFPAIIVALLFFGATIATMVMIPHPWWMWPAGIAACVIFGGLGLALSAPELLSMQTTRFIRSPVDRVFQTLANIENFSQAVPGITNVQFLSEQKQGVGTRFVETRIINGRQASTELEVTQYEQNERVRMLSDAGATLWDTVFTVAPYEDGTRMDMQMDAKPYGLFAKLMVPAILGVVSKAVESDMDAVKVYCESSQTNPVDENNLVDQKET